MIQLFSVVIGNDILLAMRFIERVFGGLVEFLTIFAFSFYIHDVTSQLSHILLAPFNIQFHNTLSLQSSHFSEDRELITTFAFV